jgi:hypothetical protein
MTNDVKSNRRSRGPSRLRQRDVRRLVSAAQSAGLSVQRVEWLPDGRLSLVTGTNGGAISTASNSWDSI